jgi:hypothetical protein
MLLSKNDEDDDVTAVLVGRYNPLGPPPLVLTVYASGLM